MSVGLPFQQRGLCIACHKPHERDFRTWHCDPCHQVIKRKQARALRAVMDAVRAGKLRPAREHVCVDCGASARDYDHRDYSKPLEVDPVCRSCNQMRGPAVDTYTLKETA